MYLTLHIILLKCHESYEPTQEQTKKASTSKIFEDSNFSHTFKKVNVLIFYNRTQSFNIFLEPKLARENELSTWEKHEW